MAEGEVGLVARDLACARGGRLLIDGLSFALLPGDLLLVRGANGAGKSTLLRQLAGLAPFTGGALLWRGLPVRRDPAGYRAQLHLLTVANALKPQLTALENLAFARRLLGGAGGPSLGAALGALEAGALADTPCGFLSTGQRRRVALARLLVAPRPLWLLDEPETGLDASGRRALAAQVERHRASGGIALVASHDAALWPASVLLELGGADAGADGFGAPGPAPATADAAMAG